MSAIVIDGTAVANQILSDTADRAAQFERTTGRKPCLATVLIGEDPASHTYVRMKTNRCRTTGLDSQRHHLPDSASTQDAVALVGKLSADDTVDGILVQHPMPPQVDERRVFEAINPAKDVDGVTGASFAAMALATKGFVSCTPGGIIRLLDAYDVDPPGNAPSSSVAALSSASQSGCCYWLVTPRSPTATPKPPMTLPRSARPTSLSPPSAPRTHQGRLDQARRSGYRRRLQPRQHRRHRIHPAAPTRPAYITPVPGGVGPTTIAVLLAQTVDAAESSHRRRPKHRAAPSRAGSGRQ